MNGVRRLGVVFVILLTGLCCTMAMGCSTLGQDRPGDPEHLDEEVRGFHSNLRWARYDHARNTVHDDYRPTFDGIYEERGDDYEIVDLSLKRVDMVEDGFAAVVESEQEWYQLPRTTVQKERFVERWVYEHGRWWMRERMLRSEYRERGEVFDSEPADEDDELDSDPLGEEAAQP